MAAVLTNETLNDEIAVTMAQIVAAANRRAKELGVEATESLITVSQHLARGKWLWRVHYGPRDYVGRRGGDLVIDVDPRNAGIRQVIKGQ